MISIIVTVYNINSKYLRKCLDSLKKQNNQNYELLIIDDGSTINGNICDEYISENTKVFHREHLGVSEARNYGISKSIGDWIIFIDGDDFVENNMTDILHNTISSKSYSDIYIFSAYINYKNKEINNCFLKQENNDVDKDELIMQMISKNYSKYSVLIYNDNEKLYNKKFIIDNNLSFVVGMERMQDMIFNLYAFENSKRISYFNNPFYHHIKNNNSVVNKFSDKTIERYEKMFFETEKFLKKYKKNVIFYDALNLKKTLSLITYMDSYFFNKDNDNKDIKKDIINLLKKDIYNNKINYALLNYHQKILIYLIKHKLLFLTKVIIKIKNLLKNKQVYMEES